MHAPHDATNHDFVIIRCLGPLDEEDNNPHPRHDIFAVKEADGTYGLYAPDSHCFVSRGNTREDMIRHKWWRDDWDSPGESHDVPQSDATHSTDSETDAHSHMDLPDEPMTTIGYALMCDRGIFYDKRDLKSLCQGPIDRGFMTWRDVARSIPRFTPDLIQLHRDMYDNGHPLPASRYETHPS